MLLRTKGKPLNFSGSLVGRVTRNVNELDINTFLILEEEWPEPINNNTFLGILTSYSDYKLISTEKVVFNIPSFDHLNNGDIVSVTDDGNINTLYRINSKHNTLLATERCNSNCLMCSQPPKDRDDIKLLFDIHSKLIPLIPKNCQQLGVSGGEPTLMGDLFFDLIEIIKHELPETELHILTNGRSFAWNGLTETLGNLNHEKVMFGIPLYSDYYQIHDYIVQAPNAFDQTILGIHNLARYNQRIEIRIVLHKLTIPRLIKLANYIYKNLPFVEHVAFMGLEYIGYTPYNIEKLWIDPYDYKNELSQAVNYLSQRGIHVSIYNTPLCILDEKDWQFARKSISDWKNEYLPECSSCSKLNECGGLFTWNLKKHSEYIKPFN